jgi:hypothetical protein
MEPNRKEHRLSCAGVPSAAAVHHRPWPAPRAASPRQHGLSTNRGSSSSPHRRQAGVTLIGFLLLAGLFGVVGLAVIKLVPMYMRNLTLTTVLTDISNELSGKAATPGAIRVALGKRFDIEGIELPPENVKITQIRDGYQVRIEYEARAHYVSDIWLLVTFDKQVDIRR